MIDWNIKRYWNRFSTLIIFRTRRNYSRKNLKLISPMIITWIEKLRRNFHFCIYYLFYQIRNYEYRTFFYSLFNQRQFHKWISRREVLTYVLTYDKETKYPWNNSSREQDILLAIPLLQQCGGRTWKEDRLHAMQHLRQRLKGKHSMRGEIARGKGSV